MVNMKNIENELNNVQYPATKQEIIQKLGNKEVEGMGGRKMPVRDVINKLPKDRFESKSEVTRELQNLPEFRQK